MRAADLRAKWRSLREQRRVGFTIWFAVGQVAWAVTVIGATPLIMFAAGQSIEAAVGDLRGWFMTAYCGLFFLVFWFASTVNNPDDPCCPRFCDARPDDVLPLCWARVGVARLPTYTPSPTPLHHHTHHTTQQYNVLM